MFLRVYFFNVVRAPNIKSMNLTDLWRCNGKLLAKAEMWCSAPQELIHLAYLKLCTHWVIPPRFHPSSPAPTVLLFASLNFTNLDALINRIIWYLSFWDWLISLGVRCAGFIYVAYCSLLLFKGWTVLSGMYVQCFFTCSFVCGLVGCVHILAVMNTATISMGVLAGLWDPHFSLFLI